VEEICSPEHWDFGLDALRSASMLFCVDYSDPSHWLPENTQNAFGNLSFYRLEEAISMK